MTARRVAWIAFALFAGTVMLYARSWSYPFLSMDDPDYPLNTHVLGGLTAENVRWAVTTGEQANWHPLTWLLLQLDATLWGAGADNPGGFRATNIVLHAANVVLLFAVLQAMTGAVGRSAVVAGLWAVHPLHVESVVWITERKDVLSTLFWLLATCAYVGYVRRPGVFRYLLVMVLMAIGLMAKPMLVTLPCVLLLLDYWPLGRTRGMPPANGRAWHPVPLGRLLAEKLPLLALSAIASLITVFVQDKSGAIGSYTAFGLAPRTAMAALAYGMYLWQTIWPTALGVYYPLERRSLFEPGVLASAALVAAITYCCWRWGRRVPYLPVGWLWFVGTLIPVIGLVQIGGMSRADRYTYVPHIGLIVAAIWGMADLLAGWPRVRAALAVVVVTVLAGACWSQIGHWQSAERIWLHTVNVTSPDNAMARLNLGFARRHLGRNEEALEDFRAVVATDPTHPVGWAYLGATLSDLKQEDESIPPLLEAVRLDPSSTEGQLMLARALVLAGRAAEAVPYFRAAGATDEEIWPAAIADGRARLALGDIHTARERFTRAKQVAPDMAEPWLLLGLCDDLSGKPREAVENLREAARLRSAPARARLAVLLNRLGDHAEARAVADDAVRLAPKDPAAHAARGLALADTGQPSEARQAFAEAARLAPEWPANTAREAMAILDGSIWRTGAAAARDAARQAWEVSDRQNPTAAATLAAADAALGHFAEAVPLAEQAAELAGMAGRPTTAEEYRRLADRYRQGKPHRD